MKSRFAPIGITILLTLFGGLFIIASNSHWFRSMNAPPVSAIDAAIENQKQLIESESASVQHYVDLAALYVQKIRETADTSFYAQIDALMDRAEKINPKDPDISAVRASVAMGRHDFRAAYDHILEVLKENTSRPAYFGLRADAEIELGLYADAALSIQKMIDLRPTFSSWSRVAYIRELNGDSAGALVALENAITSGSSFRENIAWAHVERGTLGLRSDAEAAKKDFNTALSIVTSYPPALQGLGKHALIKGDVSAAERFYLRAFEEMPLAQYAIAVGDLYTLQGNIVKAEQYFALADAAFAASAKSGVNTDFEVSQFRSNHKRELAAAVLLARSAYTNASNSRTADNLAWALHRNGLSQEALQYKKEALVIGQHDPLILFHQGIIALETGDQMLAKEYLQKAQGIDPHFSIQFRDELTRALRDL